MNKTSILFKKTYIAKEYSTGAEKAVPTSLDIYKYVYVDEKVSTTT
jgi:hypothetical protein